MITKEQYKNLKAYYDYQRLKEYNKEKLKELSINEEFMND